MQGLDHILAQHAFFAGLSPAYIRFIAGCARNHRFEAGQYLFREGEPANEFFLIRQGTVAFETVAPGREPIIFATLGEGEIAGLSWLAAPYRWISDAKAITLIRAIGIDAACLRAKCDADHDLGYAMTTRLLPILVQRLHATRLQMFDVYGTR